MNSFGKRLCVTTFGESHGAGVGCVVDGVPAGIKIDEGVIQKWLDRRKPGQNEYSTAREESDEVEILSGVFEGVTTGCSIGLLIRNKDQKSKDYGNVKELFRPSHADFTYFKKYGVRDYRGGGRASARETALRVAAAGVVNEMLKELGVVVEFGLFSVGEIEAVHVEFENVLKSDIYALDASVEEAQKEEILRAKKEHDSVGASVLVRIKNLPVGVGEPLYDKLDGRLAEAMMGINGVKAVEIGEGVNASKLRGTQNNDPMDKNGFLSNHSGGILGGISNGEDVVIKIHFKPTPSIFHKQKTVDVNGDEVICELQGRHDPCIGVRGGVVAWAMAVLVVGDLLLLNLGSKIEHLKKIY